MNLLTKLRAQRGLSARVVKSMGLFGGIQGLGIICSILKTKLVALWLGPAGVALFGIFNGAVDMVKSFSLLGIRSSSVRDIAGERNSPDLGLIVKVVRRWGILLGIFGAALMVVAAPFLSRYTFGSYDHTLSYMLLGAAVFITSVSATEEAVMQGTERFRLLARASLWGMVGGLAVSIPMFYFWRLDSIIPSIIAYTLTTNIALLVNRPKVTGPDVRLGLRQTLSAGKRFITLGIYMTASDVISQVLSYAFIAWMNMTGGSDDVGFYQAGFTIVNRYPGLVIGAIAVEYYPRLASVADSPMRIRTFVAHEMGMFMVVMTAFAAVFIPFSQLAVQLLYSDEFLVAVPFVTVAMAGVLLRGVSYCMSYVILAKGDGHTFLLTESLSAVAGLLLNIAAFSLWGVNGLGLSYTLWYLIYVFIIALVYYRRYKLSLPRALILIVCGELAAIVLCIAIAMTFGYLWALIPAGGIILATARTIRKRFF